MKRPPTATSVVSESLRVEQRELWVGGLSRSQLLGSLSSHGIHLNAYAEALLASESFDDRVARPIVVTERTVAELGLANGAPLSRIFQAAEQQGLSLCPVDTGPYLRLALHEQTTSSNPLMSSGYAPEGSLTIASAPISDDDEYPKGFYLRVVDRQAWLRGYRSDNEHQWSPDDRFVFRDGPA